MSDDIKNHPPFLDCADDAHLERHAGRVATAMETYHRKLHEEVVQLRHFKKWAMEQFSLLGLNPLNTIRSDVLKLQLAVEDLCDFKQSVERKLDDIELSTPPSKLLNNMSSDVARLQSMAADFREFKAITERKLVAIDHSLRPSDSHPSSNTDVYVGRPAPTKNACPPTRAVRSGDETPYPKKRRYSEPTKTLIYSYPPEKDFADYSDNL